MHAKGFFFFFIFLQILYFNFAALCLSSNYDFVIPSSVLPVIFIRKEDLLEIYDSLRLGIPRLLDRNLDYSLFSPDVVFVNDWHGNATTSVGLKSFVCRMALLRAVCNVLLVRAEMQVSVDVCSVCLYVLSG